MNKPTKPNITIPESFAANGVKADFDNNKILNGFDRIQPDVLAGDNLNKLIDDTYKASNYALNLGDYVLGKNQITNCILEAPNGVIDVNGLTVTLKQGVKVLIPNGLNADGTLKNYELNIPQEISRTLSSFSNAYLETILIRCNIENGDYNLTFYSVQTTYYNENKDTLLSNGIQYVKSENQWYEGQNKVYLIPLGIHKHGTSLDLVRKYNVLSILKQNDSSQISGWGMPSGKFIDLTLGASGSTYTAPANGWFVIRGIGQPINIYNRTNHIGSELQPAGNLYTTLFLPARKNDVILVAYGAGSFDYFRFIYAEGEV